MNFFDSHECLTLEKENSSKEIMKMKMKTLPLVCLVSVIAGLACGADLQANWTKHCAACHGKDGKGQTKAGKLAGVKDQTDPAYQATLKDDKMFQSIKAGLKEGDKEKMKPFAEKLTDEEIKALIAHVRTFKK